MRDHGLDTYLSDINEVPLLTAQEEIQLSKRVRRGDADAREHMPEMNRLAQLLYDNFKRLL